MKGKNLYITAAITLIAGIILIITCSTLASVKIVIWGGILFIVAAVANRVFFIGGRDREGRPRTGPIGTAVGWIASGAAVVLGLSMLLFQQTFIPLVSFMFAVLVLFAAIFQLCLLIFGSKPARLSPWLFLVPVLLFGAAVFIYLQRPGQTAIDHRIILVTGIAFAVFGVFAFIEGMLIALHNRKSRRLEEAAANNTDDKDTATTARIVGYDEHPDRPEQRDNTDA